jgi:hypothetical protein
MFFVNLHHEMSTFCGHTLMKTANPLTGGSGRNFLCVIFPSSLYIRMAAVAENVFNQAPVSGSKPSAKN